MGVNFKLKFFYSLYRGKKIKMSKIVQEKLLNYFGLSLPFFLTIAVGFYFLFRKADEWFRECSRNRELSLSEKGDDLQFLKENPDRIDWFYLSKNEHPIAIELLEKEAKKIDDKIEWRFLSINPKAIRILAKYPHKIDFFYLSRNPNPEAIALLEKYPEEIDWEELSENPLDKAINLLQYNPDKIVWERLLKNKNPLARELFDSNTKRVVRYLLGRNPEYKFPISWEES